MADATISNHYDSAQELCLEAPIVSNNAELPDESVEMAGTTQPILLSPEQLQATYVIYSDRLNDLAHAARRFEEDTNSFLRTTSDWVSGADRYEQGFNVELSHARRELNLASQALKQQRFEKVGALLANADAHLDNADTAWFGYLHGTIDGAASIVQGADAVRNGSITCLAVAGTVATAGAGAVLAAGLGASAGVHVGIMSASLDSEKAQDETLAQRQRPTYISVQFVGPASPPISNDGQVTASSTPYDTEAEMCLEKSTDSAKSEQPEKCPAQRDTSKSAHYDGKGCHVPEDPFVLEKEIEKAVKAPYIRPKTVVKDAKALEAEARNTLIDYKKDPSVHPDYGNFFLQIETPSDMDQTDLAYWKAMQDQWKKDAVTYREAATSAPDGQQLSTVMGRLFDDYLTLYVRAHSRLADFLSGRGGNCEAQTKLITAAMTAAHVPLPKGQKLAVQLFNDHVQAVIYDVNSKSVHNLLTGETTDQIYAPLYDLRIFHHTYLESQGKKSPVALQDLLIADSNVPLNEGSSQSADYSTNTTIRLPGGKGYFNDGGLVPEVAYIPRRGGQTAQVEDGLGGYRKKVVQSLDELPEQERDNFNGKRRASLVQLPFMMDRYAGSKLVFETAAQKAYYTSLASAEEQQRFLLTLTNQSIGNAFEKIAYKGLPLLANPKRLRSYKGNEIEQALRGLSDIDETWREASFTIAEHCPMPGTENNWERQRDSSFDLTRASIYEHQPLLKTVETAKDDFRRRLHRYPLKFALFMDRLTFEQRQAFAKVISFADRHYGIRLPGPAEPALSKVLNDPKLIGFGEPAGYAPQTTLPPNPKVTTTVVPQRADNIAIPRDSGRGGPTIVVVTAPKKLPPKNAELATQGTPGQRGKKVKDAALADPIQPRHTVSAKTMIDFVLLYAPSRWTPALAKEFRRLNRDGRYDQQFLKVYYTLNDTYHPRQQRFNHPRMTVNRESDCFEMMRKYGECPKLSHDIYQILQAILKRRAAAQQASI